MINYGTSVSVNNTLYFFSADYDEDNNVFVNHAVDMLHDSANEDDLIQVEYNTLPDNVKKEIANELHNMLD